MIDFLTEIIDSGWYHVITWFLALFPLVVAALAIGASRQFVLDRSLLPTQAYQPRSEELLIAQRRWPLISVIVPARNEFSLLSKTIDRALKMSWPELEIIVINDGSTDSTQEIIDGFSEDKRVKTIFHTEPRGKSASLNEAMDLAQSEVVLILDADAIPQKNSLIRLVPHLVMSVKIAAVTGNPRVIHTPNLLAKLQAIEFSSTISTIRRGQSAWGRVNTMSGIMTLLRKESVQAVGGFASDQPTEDIELTWRLHRNGYRCIYEPAAQVGMHVPLTLGAWFNQRLRWSKGLVRVLQRHGWGVIRQNEWPIYPILLEASLAILWCHLLAIMTGLWLVGLAYGMPYVGNTFIVNHMGFMAIGVALSQILWGIHLDSDHDDGIRKLRVLAPLYPLIYWMLSAIVVVLTTIPTLLTKPTQVAWDSARSISN